MSAFPRWLPWLLVPLAACSTPNEVDDPPQTLYVQAFLSPGTDPEVRLRELIAPDRYYAGYTAAVSGADVVLATDDRTAALAQRAGEPGTYWVSHDAMPVVSGRTYRLTATAGDRQLTARTTVPFPARITRIVGDTITYLQEYADSFGELLHPGEFYWDRSPNAAGYVILVEAEWVSTLDPGADTLTADLDTLIARRERLEGAVSADSLEVLDRQIEGLVDFFARNVSLVGADGRTAQWLRQRESEDWVDLDEDTTNTAGETWRKKRDELYWSRVIDYWIPVDTLRSDFWWWGVRFTGDYRVALQAADTNYFDYYSTAFNGQSGADGDNGPIFHVEGGLGVFGSYAAQEFPVFSQRRD